MEKTIDNESHIVLENRDRLCRISFFLILGSLIYSFFSHTLVSQLRIPVLKYSSTDLTYLFFHLIRLPQMISSHLLVAVCFDVMLFVSCLICLFYPQRRFWIRVFFIFFLIYFIIFNSYGLHHTHSKTGILLLPVPFMLTDGRGFLLLWQGLRYYTCYIYGSAFLWKLFRGSWLFSQQGVLIMKKNLTPYLYYNPQSGLSKVYFWLFQHPAIPDLLIKTGFLLEGLFIIGFFTRRMDKYLFLLAIVLPLGFLFVADAMFFELAFLSVTFCKLGGQMWWHPFGKGEGESAL